MRTGGPGHRPAPSALNLDPLAEAVSKARRYVREKLAAAGRDDLVDNAQLGVSELVTNAALHARSPMTVTVEVPATEPVRVSVADRSAKVPEPRRYGLTSATGRGLRILESVSSGWGVEMVDEEDGGGKVVWFEPTAEMTAAGFADEDWASEIEDLL